MSVGGSGSPRADLGAEADAPDAAWTGDAWSEMVLVGRVARPHGLKGEVVVHPETDFVEQRFRPGQRLWAGTPASRRALTIRAARVHGGRVLVAFEGFPRIEEAEGLVGLELRVPERDVMPLAPGVVYQHQLVGCQVDAVDGPVIGRVVRVEDGGAVRLVVATDVGEVLVPFAADICVEVNVAERRIRVVLPEGLLELNAPAPPRRRRASRP